MCGIWPRHGQSLPHPASLCGPFNIIYPRITLQITEQIILIGSKTSYPNFFK